MGHQVSTWTVSNLLRDAGFSLQANQKTIEGRQHPDRDGQFSYLNAQVMDHIDTADAVISVDTKKKELVGEFKNGGREWHPQGSPTPVNVHDFKDPELGKVNPYGVYDIAADTGWVTVGIDHDNRHSREHDPRGEPRGQALPAGEETSTCRRRRSTKRLKTNWPTAPRLQTGLTITVSTSSPKWNKIEHRLLPHLDQLGRGQTSPAGDRAYGLTAGEPTTITAMLTCSNREPLIP